MTRPTYERPEDLENEREIVRLICDRWRCSARKLPRKYGLDYALLRDGKVMAFIEIKDRRKYSFDQLKRLGGYMLSAEKIMHAQRLCACAALAFFLVIRIEDGVYYLKVDPFQKFDLVFGGRSDRDDWQDQEPVVLFPMGSFIRFSADAVAAA